METTALNVMNYAAKYIVSVSYLEKEYDDRMLSIAQALTANKDEAGSLVQELKMKRQEDKEFDMALGDGLSDLSATVNQKEFTR